MNWWTMIGGILSLATAAIHLFLGGPEINAPIQSNDSLSPEVRATMAVVWQGVTAVLLLSGAVSIYAAYSNRMRPALALIAAQYLALSALFVGYGIHRFGSLWVMPQWTLFIVLIGLIGMGLRHPTPPRA